MAGATELIVILSIGNVEQGARTSPMSCWKCQHSLPSLFYYLWALGWNYDNYIFFDTRYYISYNRLNSIETF